MYSGKVNVFGKKCLYSGKSGCVRAKVVVFGQRCLYSGKVNVFGQKWLFSGKKGCIQAKWLYSGKSGFIVTCNFSFGVHGITIRSLKKKYIYIYSKIFSTIYSEKTILHFDNTIKMPAFHGCRVY